MFIFYYGSRNTVVENSLLCYFILLPLLNSSASGKNFIYILCDINRCCHTSEEHCIIVSNLS